MSIFNIPTQFTQGDSFSWYIKLGDYNPATDTLSCFIRGQSALDLTGISNADRWDFAITSVQSAELIPGKYKKQYVIFKNGTKRETLWTADLLVCQSFENLTELETRTPDEIELEAVTKAIAQLSSKNVAEYYIGTRKVRYNDLASLYERQKYLRNRIAKSKNKAAIGGRNVRAGFRNW